MKWRLELEGDYYEDKRELDIQVHASDMYSRIMHTREFIRNHLKYEEGLSQKEVSFLEKIREFLFFEWDE